MLRILIAWGIVFAAPPPTPSKTPDCCCYEISPEINYCQWECPQPFPYPVCQGWGWVDMFACPYPPPMECEAQAIEEAQDGPVCGDGMFHVRPSPQPPWKDCICCDSPDEAGEIECKEYCFADNCPPGSWQAPCPCPYDNPVTLWEPDGVRPFSGE